MKKSIFILVSFLLSFIYGAFPQKSFLQGKAPDDQLTVGISVGDPLVYCSSTYTNTTDDWISNVSFNSINNSSGQEGPTSYMDYTTSYGTGVVVGNTYNLSVSFVSNGYTEHVWAWFDWNGDDDFTDAGEAYDLGQGADATLSMNITIPSTGFTGWTRMRITEQYSTDPTPCDPHPTIYGETEDYGVMINVSSYCYASGGCDEFISSVIIGNTAYSTGCYGYSSESFLYFVPVNTSAPITVYNGNPYAADQCGIWIDWNKDNDFYDANETLVVNGTPGLGPYTATLVPPAGISLGNYTLRTRIIYTGTLDPCGNTPYGEVEDYVISIIPQVPCAWTGAVDNNWHNPDNWNTINIPDATTDVLIPNTTNKCWIYAGAAYCKNLTLESGSGYDLRVYDKVLNVVGDMTMEGQLLMDHPNGQIIANGNITWQSGSSASIQANAIIEVHGDWTFNPGANVMMNNGIVNFTGAASSYIVSNEAGCYFNDVVIYKSSPYWASIPITGSGDLNIHGDLGVEPGSTLYMHTPLSVRVGGDFLCLGSFYGQDGTMVFNGTTQNILMGAGAIAQHFNNLTIGSAVSTTLLNQDITVNGNLIIESGQLVSNNLNITLYGYWLDQVGPAGFDEGSGRVILAGYSENIYGTEEFNILELNKTGAGDRLDIDGSNVTCQQFDWSKGLVSVRLGGEFTAFDLADDGIYGGWGIDNTGGTINISNYDGYVDLNGLISLTGGTMNVYGGTTPSYWPYADNGEIYMTDGVLDFHDQGIYIYSGSVYALTENITGGTIRTAGGFWGEAGSFTPAGGTLEFYGPLDADIYTLYGCYLNNVNIDKGAKGKMGASKSTIPLIDKKSGKSTGDGTLSNSLNLADFLDINGNLTITSGVLNSNGYPIQIAGSWTNSVGDAGFNEAMGTVFFDGSANASILSNETFYHMILNKTWSGDNGLKLDPNLQVTILDDIDLDDGSFKLSMNSILRINGNLFIANEAGLNAGSGSEIKLGGDWTNENATNTATTGFYPAGNLVTFDGTFDQLLTTNAGTEFFSNLHINKQGGYFRPNNNIEVAAFFVIFNGHWWDNIPGLNHKFWGNILFESGGVYQPQGTTHFKGVGAQYYENNGGSAIFADVVIDKSGLLYLNSSMVVFGGHTTTIEQGILMLNGNSFKSTGDIFINNGGELRMDAGSILSIVEGLYVNNGGLFTASGAPGNNARVFKDVIGYYDFQVQSGGTISANYTQFEKMNSNGIWVKNGAWVDPANAFNNCNFLIGTKTSNSTMLTIDNNEVININNIQFNNNPYIASAYNIAKNLSQGEITLTNYSGDFAGEKYDNDVYDRVHWAPKPVALDVKVLLEGPFNGTEMNTDLNAILPLNQPFGPPLPYFGNPMPDWYYSGSESVIAIPNPQIVDWVALQIRQGLNPASTTDILATQAAFVNNLGNVVGLDGSSYPEFNVSYSDQLYLVVWHRNHLGVISANPLMEAAGVYSYDFTSSSGQAVGGSAAQKQIGAKWAMMTGDGNGDGLISTPDIMDVWNLQSGNVSFFESDFDMNSQVNNQDKNDQWYPNSGMGSYVPE